ncbi:MAG TPA: DUF1937 family protein [bacterium]|nr:DUF1937 family protein [bacterium]
MDVVTKVTLGGLTYMYVYPEKTFVYVAGPYRGQNSHDFHGYFDIDININRATQASAALARFDIPYFCPHMNSAHFEVICPDVKPQYWLEMDMVFVDLASCLYVLEGWEDSEGTKAEIIRATSLDKPVFYFFELEKLVEFWREIL